MEVANISTDDISKTLDSCPNMEVGRTYINWVATAVITYFIIIMSLLSEFTTHFDIRIETVLGGSFVKLKFKTNYEAFLVSENVDVSISNAMHLDGIKLVGSVERVETKCQFNNVKGILFLKNIVIPNGVHIPHNVIILTTANQWHMAQSVIQKLFGSHIGDWSGQWYTAALFEPTFPCGDCNDRFFLLMAKLMNDDVTLSSMYRAIIEMNSIISNKKHSEWWNLYFKLVGIGINRHSRRDLPTNVSLHKVEWQKLNIVMEKECEICLTSKPDIGILYNDSFSHQETYVSPMLVCFSCYVTTNEPIRDSGGKDCYNWIPLFHTILGNYLLRKSGNYAHLYGIIEFLLGKDHLNEKELFIVECLLVMFQTFNPSTTNRKFIKIIRVVSGKDHQLDSSCPVFLRKLVLFNGTLFERLRLAYSNSVV